MHESKDLQGLKWGSNGPGVRISRLLDDELQVGLDLLKVVDGWPNPDFDITFRIRSIQSNDRLEIRVESEPKLTADGPIGRLASKKQEYKDAKTKVREMFRQYHGLTAGDLERLGQAGVPPTVIETLTTLLKDKRFSTRDEFIGELSKVLGPGQLNAHQQVILEHAFHDPGLLGTVRFAKNPANEFIKLYCVVDKDGGVTLEIGDDPMVAQREEWERTRPERERKEEIRQRQQREHNKELEP